MSLALPPSDMTGRIALPLDFEDFCAPASAVLALRDLAHQAVDMVCERLSNEPLSNAVFAEEVAP